MARACLGTVLSARAFGVEPSYLVDGTGEAVLDREIVEALSDDTIRAIARESARVPDRERKLVLGILRQLEGARPHEEADLDGAPSGGGRGGFGDLPLPAYSPSPVSSGSTLS